MKNLYKKLCLAINVWLLLLAGVANAQDGINNAFAFGGGSTVVDEMRYATDGDLYFVARLGGKNIFAGTNYDAGAYGQYPLQQWVFGKVSPTGQQTVLKVFDRNANNNNLYNSLGGNQVIDKDGNLISIITGTFPSNDYGDGFVETGYGAKIAKTNKNGTVQWVKPINTGVDIEYGNTGTTLPNVNGLQVMDDGSVYLIVASNNKITDSNSPYFDKYPTRIIKFNPNGDEVWHHEIFADRNALSFVVSAPKQFVDNNGNLVVTVTIPSSHPANFISGGTTLTATNSYSGNYFCLMGLDNTGTRKWFHSATAWANLRAVDPANGTVYVAYTYTGANNTPPPIAPYSTLPNINPSIPFLNSYIWSGMLKLDITTGNITNAVVNLPASNMLSFLTKAKKLHVRANGNLIFYEHKENFSAIGDYLVPDNYNAVIFTDANYGNIKVSQALMPKATMIAENSTNFAISSGFNAAFTLSTGAVTPFVVDTDFGTRFPLFAAAKTDAYIAQGDIAQIGGPKTTKWTGTTSTAWNDATNWSNGIADVGTIAEFDTNVANQPTVAAATTVGKIIINSGVTATLPASNLTIKNKLIINGTFKYPVAGFGYFTGYSSTGIEGNGTIEFNGTGSATFLYTVNGLQTFNLKTNVALSTSGAFKTVEFVGTSAKITGDINIVSTNENAIIGASNTNYIVGKLTRNIAPATNYSFPVGTSSYYLPASINTNNLSGVNNIKVEISTNNVSTPDINLGGITVNRVTNNGFWKITPDAQPISGTYSITLNKNNATNGDTDATKYLMLKTSAAGSLYSFEGSLGSRNQTDGTGSNPNFKNSAISVTQNDLETFNDYIIAVASAPITPPLAVSNSTWTGAANTEWNNASNWSNGVPTSTVKAVIPSGLANYPLVYNNLQVSYLKELTINAGANVNLSNMLSVSNSIVNNGTITINTTNNAYSGLPARAALTGTGKVIVEKPQVYTTVGSATGDMDCDLDVNIGDANTINLIGKYGGNINIISGQITARDNGVSWFTPTKATATIQITAPVNNIAGRIWKTVNAGSGTYDFPLGNDQYHRSGNAGGRKYGSLTITNNNITNITQYVAWFDAYFIDAVAVANGTDVISDYVNSGQWSVQISGATSTGGNINLTFKTSDYTNGRASINDYVLLRKEGSSTTWTLVNGATFTQSGGLITATANTLAPIAPGNPTKFCIGLKASTTTWTGNANNGNWNTAANWSNGIPTSAVKVIFNGSATNFPTTNIPTSNAAASVEVQSGATLVLPTSFSTSLPIINNGTIEVKGTGDFVGFGNSPYTTPTGNGKLKFTSNSPNRIYGGYLAGYAIENSLEIDNPAGVTVFNSNLNLGGSLILTSGKLTVATNYTLSMTNANATISGASASSYIIGNFNRAVNTAGSYTFPVGSASAYAPATLQLNNIVGPTTIAAKYSSDAIDGQPNLTIGGNTVNSLLAGGSWEITPSPSLTSGSYDVSLSAPLGSSTAGSFAVLKRPYNYSFAQWENQGTNQPSSVSGGMVTASVTGLTSFSQFGIGELPAGTLPVKLVKFTAKAESQSVLLNWETASEQHNDKFVVERSADGKIFFPLNDISSKGNSNTLITYTLRDKTPLNGINYYRLKQVDLDGTVAELGISSATFNFQSLTFNLYPNPVSTVLNFNGLNGKKGFVNWYNASGQKIATSTLTDDKTTVPTKLPNGLYIIKMLLHDGTLSNYKVNVYR